MRLNDVRPGFGSKRLRKRVGRGSGSGHGKTCGRGQKGQRSRAGAGAAVGFEGGQMPLQRRLPKYGFASRKAAWTAEVRLSALARVGEDVIDLETLKKAGIVARSVKRAKIIATGSLDKSLVVRGLRASKGAQSAIQAAGGSVEA